MCRYMDQLDFSFLYVVSQKMIPHFYVFVFGLKHWVLCNTYGTSAVTLKWDMGILLTKVTHGVCDPKELRATTSCGHILCLGSGLSNTQLFARRPRHQRRTQELASPRSGLPIQPTPGKIRVRKSMKSQKRRRRVPNGEVVSVTQISEDAFDWLPMRSPWRRLKMSAQTYQKLDVRPRHHQVEEWLNHSSVLLLVHMLTFLHNKSYSCNIPDDCFCLWHHLALITKFK
jgi:hypothetical protein